MNWTLNMDKLTLLTLAASVALPLVPQVIALSLLFRIWRSGQTRFISLAASGMVQVMSGLWLVRSLTKLPLFFDSPRSPAYEQWSNVTLESGPYLAASLSLLVGWFWCVLAWGQRKSKNRNAIEIAAVPATVKEVLKITKEKTAVPSVFVKPDSKKRQKKKKR
jgi:hypothetical protein